MRVFLTLLSLLFFPSCSSKIEEKGKTIRYLSTTKVKGMDPIFASDTASVMEVARIYEGLMEYHYLTRPLKATFNLAKEMPTISPDGTTYIFKIRQGIFFHNDPAFPQGKGRELVAQDFVYSFKRLADPKLQGRGFWVVDGKIKGLNEWREKAMTLSQTNYHEKIEGLQAVDRYTLQFKLTRPFPQFLYILTMPFTFVVAKEVVEHYGKEFLNHPVGTGPFVLPLFQQQANKIIYKKNPHYRQKLFPCQGSDKYKPMIDRYCGKPLPLVDRVEVNIMVEPWPQWLNFQKGKLDFLSIPKDNFEQAVLSGNKLSQDYLDKGIELIISPILRITYTSINHDLKLFQNFNLRCAMSLAYDIHRANKLFHNNTAIPLQGVIPRGLAGHLENYKNPCLGEGKKENIQRAKKLLAQAGYPGGKNLPPITYDCRSGPLHRQKGEYFKRQMAQIGIKVNVIQSTWPEFLKKIVKRQVMVFAIGWGADYPDGENFLQLLYGPNQSPGPNGSGYNDPEFNKRFTRAVILEDSPERTILYQNLNRMVSNKIPWIFGVHIHQYELKHKWVKNFVPTNYSWGREAYLDIDQEVKKKTLQKL